MKKNIRVTEPSQEMLEKIVRARETIATQKERLLKCAYCRHTICSVYEDTEGDIKIKCAKCGCVTVFNPGSMRRLPLHAQG